MSRYKNINDVNDHSYKFRKESPEKNEKVSLFSQKTVKRKKIIPKKKSKHKKSKKTKKKVTKKSTLINKNKKKKVLKKSKIKTK
jgi:hypothetical protein